MKLSRMVLSAALLAIAFGTLAACMQSPDNTGQNMEGRMDGHGMCCDYSP